MEHHRGHTERIRERRTRAERDAVTVEIGYALFSAVFVAALGFGVVAGPALFLDLSRGALRTLVACGATLATVLFFVRTATVLVRFRQEPAAQPSHPGRTNPDS